MGLLGVLLAASACLAADPFLKVVGRDIRDDRGKGSAVVLRGANLGSWLIMEGWMCPMDSSGLKDDFSVRETLIRRFGWEGKDRLLAAYQGNVQVAVGGLLAGISLLDASWILAAGRPRLALAALGCFVLTLVLQRRVPAS